MCVMRGIYIHINVQAQLWKSSLPFGEKRCLIQIMEQEEFSNEHIFNGSN